MVHWLTLGCLNTVMQSRSKRFVAGMVTGYGLMAFNIAYTMLSIPLALRYLGKEEFGLWALAQQVAGYLMLLELGMSTAVSRFLADFKDDVNGGHYGSLLLTGTIVFAIQGLLIALCGVGASLIAPELLSVPIELRPAFRDVLAVLSLVSGASLAVRTVSAPLWAFNRVDIINIFGISTLISNFITLWIGFHHHWGVYSFAFAGIPALFLSTVVAGWFCSAHAYYPRAGSWGRPQFTEFWRLFAFGKDYILMVLGSNLVNATQVMLISRLSGLEAAATFAVATKLYAVGQQLVSKVLDSCSPALTELYVRKELTRFNQRYWEIVALAMLLATVCACGLAFGNRAFISIWVGTSIEWSLACDGLLALLVVATAVTRCMTMMFGPLGDLRPVRSIYLVEGVVFVALAIPSLSSFGMTGLLGASVGTHLLVTGSMSVRAAAGFLNSMNPLKTLVLVSLLSVLVTMVVAFALQPAKLSPLQLLALTPLVVIGVGAVGFRLMIPRNLYAEIFALVTRRLKS